MKRCIKCGKEKSLGDFYPHPKMADGHLGKCKECCRDDVKANIAKRSKDKAWLKKERERCRAKQALARANGTDQQRNPEAAKKWASANKSKRRAQSKAGRAVQKGILRKPKLCSACGRTAKLEKHHPDYNLPLLVVWLCAPCHGKTRRKN